MTSKATMAEQTVQLEMSISGGLDNLRRTMPWENSDKRGMINSQRKRYPCGEQSVLGTSKMCSSIARSVRH